MSDGKVRYEQRDQVALLQIDDGKVNALSHEVIDGLERALDRAAKDAKAVVLTGRPGRFSAGFDLSVMGQGGDAVVKLVSAGAELGLRIYGFELPVVIACSGHAVAMGALLCLCGDERIGAQGSFKIGLNEVAIGMTLPVFAMELALARLSKRELTRATVEATLYDPESAVEAGFLDRVVPADSLLETALAEATRLTSLDAAAYAATKRRLRAETLARIREKSEFDLQGFGGN